MTVEWFNTGAGAASIVGLIVTIGAIIQAMITGRSTRRLQADIHASTQLALADMRKGFTESQERLGQILERMDQRADERHRDTITAIETLRRP
jgi:hypothetical protein